MPRTQNKPTQSNVSLLKAAFLTAHFELLDRLYKITEQRTLSGDFDESKYYEGWDTILNHFRAETNEDITIAPQRRFVRNFYQPSEPGMLFDSTCLLCEC